MLFLGIDLGWTGRPSGAAALAGKGRRLELVKLDRPATHAATLDWIAQQCGEHPCYLGLDAPVIVTNRIGMREADRMAHRLFSREKAGCYPVNLGMPFTANVLAFVAELREQGFATAPAPQAQAAERRLFEVYPHAACVRLFGLDRILPYKKGPLAQRKAALAQLRELLANGLARRHPSFACPELPQIPATGAELKAVEDQLDAVLCAYVAAHYWHWGAAKNNLLGAPQDGFIVVPSF